MQGFAIRIATPEDAEAIADLATQLWYPSQAEDIRRRWKSLSPARERVFVAVAEGVVVGFVHVALESTLLVDRVANLRALVVDERWRGRGIGRELVRAAERWAQGAGCSTIWVRSNIKRVQAHPFYERLGYSHLKTSFVFTKRLEPGER